MSEQQKDHEQSEIEQLRETVEVQARTIRHLLANYDALLKKVEAEQSNGGSGGSP